MEWCQLSRGRGDPLASNLIGLMYQNGHDVSVDYTLALRHYLKSAQQGFRSSFCNIGELFETAKGVSMNKQMALAWYSKDESFGAKHVKRLNDQGYYIAEWEKGESY
jgi:TPR repeat protein